MARGAWIGAFEGFAGDGSLQGWACPLPGSAEVPRLPRVRLVIEDLLRPGRSWPLAELTASLPRPDLDREGLSHQCGFSFFGRNGIELPARSTGLVMRALLVTDPSVELAGSPLRLDDQRYQLLEQLCCRSGSGVRVDSLHGPFLVCWASPGRELELRLDGASLGIVTANDEGQIQAPLPPEQCDGQVHHFALHDNDGALQAESLEITPFQLTPWSSLHDHGQAPFPDQLHPLAREHHRSLTTWLQWADADGTPLPRDLPLLQRLLSGPVEPPATAAANQEAGPDGSPVNRAPIHLPLSPEPLVSIVVPVHNSYSVTRRCLAGLAYAPTRVAFELIVVDDGSSDGTSEALAREAPGVQVIRHDYARGFNQACHSGASAARGEYVVLLNNDTEPCCRWLEELLEPFRRWSDTGMSGAQLIHPDGRLQEAGGIVWGNGEPWNYGRGRNPYHPGVAYTRQVDYVSGAALAIRRDLWIQIGGFSPEFSPAYYEDTDLGFKVRQAGLVVRYAPLARVIHHEGLSCGTDTDPDSNHGLKRFQTLHAPLFQRKWKQAFSGVTTPSFEAAESIKDRGILGRALVLDHGTPRPDRDAGSHAALVEMELIQALGYKITFVPANLAWLGSYTEDLQRRGIETIHAPFVLSLERFLQERGCEFDLVYLTRYTTVRDSIDLLKKHARQAKLVFCNADLHYLRELRQAQAAGLSGEAAERALDAVRDTRRQELEAMAAVDLTLSYSEIEQAVIAAESLGQWPTARCPWVVDTHPNPAPLEGRSGISFLGSYQHPPNRDAMEWFLQEIWPRLREQVPDLNFHIYGSGLDAALLEAWQTCEGVQVHGWVRDVADVYAKHRVFVAPLRSGAGIKGKVIAALAHGMPQVLSPVAAEATGLRHACEIFIAQDPQGWCNHISGLIHDDDLWRRTSAAALEHARHHYSRDRGLELMATALGQLHLPVCK
ncbi:glycosyltransferase [Synechococcus sp. J7-Johnson]|uniref:glycosyltransferase n=1 Tax=Synechococcus sp. J7-Johnson TaxID=2823737 RepID=UPI0020CE5BCD|nr:glycosyltransferase [Synechococcus sp. J7-Johnson]MCP9839608.1 glycosyltransferase [Synechococcus sp. J7-Johnson]